MPNSLNISFADFARPRGDLVVFCGEGLKLGPATKKTLAPLADQLQRAAAADRFSGKADSTLDIVAPSGLDLLRLIVVGTGKKADLKSRDIVKLGGIAMGIAMAKLPAAAARITIFAEFGDGALQPRHVAELALGARLRA